MSRRLMLPCCSRCNNSLYVSGQRRLSPVGCRQRRWPGPFSGSEVFCRQPVKRKTHIMICQSALGDNLILDIRQISCLRPIHLPDEPFLIGGCPEWRSGRRKMSILLSNKNAAISFSPKKFIAFALPGAYNSRICIIDGL
jgi:hypothetical protein